MEAIMVGGVAVLAVGGYFSIIDFMGDLGFGRKKSKEMTKSPYISQLCRITHQTGIKKMAGMHI
jgi:hypothetical protein